MAEKIRVQKILAQRGLCSRRKAEEIISAGRVTVNGRPIKLGDGACPGKDTIAVDGEPLPREGEKPLYLAAGAWPSWWRTQAAGCTRWGVWTRIRKACCC